MQVKNYLFLMFGFVWNEDMKECKNKDRFSYGYSYESARELASKLPNTKYALNILYWFTSSLLTFLHEGPPTHRKWSQSSKETLHNPVSYILFVYTKSEVYEVSTLLSKIIEASQDKFTEIKSYKIIMKTKITF